MTRDSSRLIVISSPGWPGASSSWRAVADDYSKYPTFQIGGRLADVLSVEDTGHVIWRVRSPGSTRAVSKPAWLPQGIRFGWPRGADHRTTYIIYYVVQPMPGALVVSKSCSTGFSS